MGRSKNVLSNLLPTRLAVLLFPSIFVRTSLAVLLYMALLNDVAVLGLLLFGFVEKAKTRGPVVSRLRGYVYCFHVTPLLIGVLLSAF
mgnify:CR=1 FL=1